MKNTEITDEFFSALVTKAGTKYVIAIADRAKFIAFGNKYLSTPENQKRLSTKYEKYNISESNSSETNEKGFMKMMTEINTGINVFKGNSDFSDWQKLSYSSITNLVTPAAEPIKKPCN